MHTIIENKKVEQKRLQELRVIEEMINSYCRSRHDHTEGLCTECTELLQYAKTRSQRCPFMEEKTFCSNCKVHCYKPDMRNKIRIVMRDRGVWMLFHHPILSIRHFGESIKEKRNWRRNDKEKID